MFITLFIMLIIAIATTKWIVKGYTNPATLQALQKRQMIREQMAASSAQRRF